MEYGLQQSAVLGDWGEITVPVHLCCFYLLNGDHNCAYFTGFERIKLENLYKVFSKLHSKEVIPCQHYLQFYLK